MKIPIPRWAIKLAMKFADLEAFSDTSKPDMRMYEYSWTIGELIKLPAGNLLDIGCTASLNMIPATMCELGWNVWGMDIRRFEYKHKNFRYIESLAQIPTMKFDAITAISSLEHFGISGRYGIRKTEEELAKITLGRAVDFLKDSGTVLITLPYSPGESYIRDSMKIYNTQAVLELINPMLPSSERIVGSGEDTTIMVKAVKQNYVQKTT